eukprot:10083162-Prorocentrum_lima.AAC.1
MDATAPLARQLRRVAAMVCPTARMLARSVAAVSAPSICRALSANLSAARLQWMLFMGGSVRYVDDALMPR